MTGRRWQAQRALGLLEAVETLWLGVGEGFTPPPPAFPARGSRGGWPIRVFAGAKKGRQRGNAIGLTLYQLAGGKELQNYSLEWAGEKTSEFRSNLAFKSTVIGRALI